MEQSSRTVNSLKNIAFGYGGRILTLGLSFVSRTIFIQILGATYLGINGLFSTVLGLLSFTELGIGTALNYSLYKPVAEQDYPKIRALMRLYQKAYRYIALVITVLGLGLLPVIPYINPEIQEIPQVEVYYLIFLFNTVSTYFVSYKYGLVNAEQKNYILTNIDTVGTMFVTAMQMAALLLWQNFLVYLLVQSAFQLVQKIVTAVYLNQRYKDLLTGFRDEQVEDADKKRIVANTKALILERISSACIYQTDNILIGIFVSISMVGIASNYELLIMTGISFLNIAINGLIASCGNFIATKSPAEVEKLFDAVDFFGFVLFSIPTIICFVLMPDFITLWIGEDMLMEKNAFLLMALNACFVGQRSALMYFRVAGGLFVQGKYAALVQAIANMVISIAGAYWLGLAGIYLGTVLSGLVIMIWRPIVMYKVLFHKSAQGYFLRFWGRIGLILLLVVILWQIKAWLPWHDASLSGFVVMLLLCLTLPAAVYWLLYHHDASAVFIVNRLRKVCNR